VSSSVYDLTCKLSRKRFGIKTAASCFMLAVKLTKNNFRVSYQLPVTKIENIKTDLTKILRPTHFSGPKDIKTDGIFVGLNH
jgi:hypothetical protein